MKVLFVTNHLLNDNGGGAFASSAYINAFAAIANEIILLYPIKDNEITLKLSSKVVKKAVSYNRSNFGKFIDIYIGRINRFYKIINEVIFSFQPDIVVFDNSRSSAGYIKLLRKTGIKLITIHHNYEKEYYNDTKPPLLWRLPFMYYMKRAEQIAVRLSDLNITLTKQDLNLLQKHYDIDRNAIFDCLGVFEYCKNDIRNNDVNHETNKDELVFAITGSLAAHQTEISLIPFIKRYYPLIIKHYPKSSLIIAGKNPTTKLKSLCAKYPNIKLIANPVDMSAIISNANVYICPVCVGGGLKLRVMDGLKLGLPVLTHKVSARGYDDFFEAEFLYTYDNEDTFVQSLKSVVECKASKLDIIRKYSDIFSFTSGANRLKEILLRNKIL